MNVSPDVDRHRQLESPELEVTTLAMRPRTIAVFVLLAGVCATAGLMVGAVLESEQPDPSDTSVAAGFARDMQIHHSQAVQMSVLVRDRTDDTDVRQLALDIMLTQQQQAGQMYGWLADWSLPQTGPSMAWMTRMEDQPMAGMDHRATRPSGSTSDATMPGMADDGELERLTELSGQRAERLYLQLMIRHHEGGVEMAEYAAPRAEDVDVARLASSILASQTAEIATLTQMLAERGGPLRDPSA